MKRAFFLGAALLGFFFNAVAQWVEISPFQNNVEDIKVFEGKLYLGGNFLTRDGQTAYWSSAYDGTGFEDHGYQVGGNGIKEFAVFDSSLFAAGYMFNAVIARWADTTWQGVSALTESHSAIFADDSAIYVGSDYGLVSYSTDGMNFDTLPRLSGQFQNIYAITKFQGELIVAGRFDSAGTTRLNSIARWDGSNWQAMGNGVSGSSRKVNTMVVFQDTLYIGGSFTAASGVPAAKMAKWDGQNWHVMSAGLYDGANGVMDLMADDTAIYAVGDFLSIGGLNAKRAAWWDGSAWNQMNFQVGDEVPSCIARYNGSLYLGTLDSRESALYRFDGVVAVPDPISNLEALEIWPNPNSGEFSIKWNPESAKNGLQISLIDLQGREIAQQFEKEGWAEFQLPHLAKGIYWLRFQDAKSMKILATRKIMVQ